MDELSELERQPGVIEDALRTYPMQPAPATLLPAVMRRIQARQPAALRSSPGLAPRFRPTWVDAAVSLFAASMGVLAWGLWPALPLPIDWAVRLRFQFLVWQQQLYYGLTLYFPGLALSAGIALEILALLAACGLAAYAWSRNRRGGNGSFSVADP